MNRHSPLRRKLPLFAVVTGILVIFAIYVFGLALIQSRMYKFYDFDDLVMPRCWDAVIMLWLLYCGGSIGSFLNVVAWRMPRGESINGLSHCPRCAHRLLGRDNVPVLGWISLRGRCRFCSLPISRRYPIVEALVAVCLALIGIAELYVLALPAQSLHWHGGPLWAPRLSPLLIGVLVYHVTAVASLWGYALIRMDGVRLPKSLIAFALIAVTLPMLLVPQLMVVPWQATRPETWIPDAVYYDGLMRLVTAFVAATLIGRILGRGLAPSADLKLDPLGQGSSKLIDLIMMLSIPAVVVGWQSMPALVFLAAVLSWALQGLLNCIPINDGPQGHVESRGSLERFAFALPLATTLHVVFWRYLWSFPYWPSDISSRNVIIGWSLSLLVLPMFLRDRPKEPQHLLGDELPSDHGDPETDDGNERGDDSPSP